MLDLGQVVHRTAHHPRDHSCGWVEHKQERQKGFRFEVPEPNVQEYAVTCDHHVEKVSQLAGLDSDLSERRLWGCTHVAASLLFMGGISVECYRFENAWNPASNALCGTRTSNSVYLISRIEDVHGDD